MPSGSKPVNFGSWELLQKGAIAEIPVTQPKGGFTPPILSPRRWRAETSHESESPNPFYTSTLQDERNPYLEDRMVKVDLKDAYFTISIQRLQRKYLRFMFQEKVDKFNCLPFDLL